jgi:hypothetical protein
MIRRSSVTLSLLLGAASIAAILAGCETATTSPGASAHPVTAPSPSQATSGLATASPNPSGSVASGSPTAVASDPLGLPHLDSALEALLPDTIGGVVLQRFSVTLQAYMQSTPGAGENALYPPWLVKLGKTPAEAIMAVAADLRPENNLQLVIHAIRVPGIDAATLSSSFSEIASNAGWPVTPHPNYASTGKTVIEIIDPAAQAAGEMSAGYVYAKGDVLYTIIVGTGLDQLLLEALIKLP